jgi:hypothetical protein
VAMATTAALPACTYANGTAGVGATLTGNSNGALAAIDGVTPDTTANNSVLVKNQAAAAQNGVYWVTQVGDASHPFILTRREDANDPARFSTAHFFPVATGSVNGSTIYMSAIGTGSVTFGTTAIGFNLVASSRVIVTDTGNQTISITSVADKDQLVYDSASGTWKNQRPRYIIGASALSGVLTVSQVLLLHKFTKAITFPANFGAYLGHASEAGGTAAATGSTVINVDKATAAAPNTFSNVGTITIGSGGVVPTFATSGGATVSFAQGDVLRIIGPSSPDATFANFYASLVGYET